MERDVYVIKIRREVTTGTGKVVARRSPFQPEGTSLEVTLVMGSRSLERPSSGGLGARRGERGGVPSCFSPAHPAQPKAYTVSIFSSFLGWRTMCTRQGLLGSRIQIEGRLAQSPTRESIELEVIFLEGREERLLGIGMIGCGLLLFWGCA